MAKVSSSLASVFTLVLALQLIGSVLGQDPWASMLDQATKAGLSQETINEAQKAFGDGSAQKAAADVLGDDGGSLGDWVQQADDTASSTLAASPTDQSDFLDDDDDDDVDDSMRGAPKASPSSWAPEQAPTTAPKSAPKTARSPNLAPHHAPTQAPEMAPSPSPRASSPKPHYK